MRFVVPGLFLFVALPVLAADPTEDDYYPITTLPIPKGLVLEVGGLCLMPDGKLAVSTRRGDIYLVDNPKADDLSQIHFTKFAGGLHEVLGLAYRDGWLYATQRGELSRLKDSDGDGRADIVETVCDDWEISGDYHEYAFGSDFDKEGNIWVVLCLTGSFTSNCKFRGWCLRITKDGKAIPTCSGIRSPGGIGMNHLGDVFYTDNQGPWNGTCALKWLKPGSFQGHPAGNKWYSQAPNMKQPETPNSNSRIMTEADRIPELMPPAVMFPYDKMGKSASGIACDTTGGKFGVFKNQLFVGDQSHSTVMRVFLEKIKDRYQGACFMFRQGFASGTLPLLMTPDGYLFAGGTNRGWGSRGNKPFALERVKWTGKVPFEVLEMRAKPDGFELVFTKPVATATASDPKSYLLKTYTYIYRSQYGSPEVDHTNPNITKITVSQDQRTVRLYIDKLQRGHVHELHLNGVRSQKENLPLLHRIAYYTLNYIPEE
ncbi:MAG: hypothetical protein KatS3mg105_1366 [Gemmatales bacterium]|nr:MAG: hypothetical protein KatS3mg105_1366 [Gemmatales bacterium]